MGEGGATIFKKNDYHFFGSFEASYCAARVTAVWVTPGVWVTEGTPWVPGMSRNFDVDGVGNLALEHHLWWVSG